MARLLAPLALSLLVLLAADLRPVEAADAIALGAQLKDPDLDIALAASGKLLAMGAEAAPALPALIEALGRFLPPGIARKHWDPWMGILPQFHRNVIRTIDRIGPKEPSAIPALRSHLEGGRSADRSLIVGMMIRLWPHEGAARSALPAVAAGGLQYLDADASTALRTWLAAEGAAAISAYDGMLGTAEAADRLLAAERLHGMGAPGLTVLVKHFRTESINGKGMLLDLWAHSGRIPVEAMPDAIEWFAREGTKSLLRAIDASATDRDAVAAELAKALSRTPFHFPGWTTLSKVAPDLAGRTGRRWFETHKPVTSTALFDGSGLRRTALLGGVGGSPFESVAERGTLVGLRYTHGTQNWKPVIRSIQPLFETPDGIVEGKIVGGKGPKSGEIRANDGYAIAGLYVQATDRFEAFAVLFMRKKGAELDPSDAYIHSWHGGAIIGREETLIGGEGLRIVGITGRSGADVDALGLVEAKRSAEALPPK